MVQDDVDAVQARQKHYHKTLKIKGFTAGVVEKLQIQKVVVAVMENIQGHARGWELHWDTPESAGWVALLAGPEEPCIGCFV